MNTLDILNLIFRLIDVQHQCADYCEKNLIY